MNEEEFIKQREHFEELAQLINEHKDSQEAFVDVYGHLVIRCWGFEISLCSPNRWFLNDTSGG